MPGIEAVMKQQLTEVRQDHLSRVKWRLATPEDADHLEAPA